MSSSNDPDSEVEHITPTTPSQPFSAVRSQLIILGFFPFSEHIAWTSIFPYIYALVSRLTSTSDPEGHNVAFYAGILLSVFTFGEFLMAPIWGSISDRFGRKPTLLIGSLGAVFAALSFGLSTTLPMLIVVRLAAGMANPNLGVLRTYVAELVSREHQARGFSIISFSRSFGSVVGPVVGGYLAEPAVTMPVVFGGKVWREWPYLLPNLVVVFFLVVSCTCGFLVLEEVHPLFRARRDLGRKLATAFKGLVGRRSREGAKGEYEAVAPDEGTDLTPTTQSPLVSEKPNFHMIDRRKAFTNQVLLQILSSTILGFIRIATLALIPVFLGTPSTTTTANPSIFPTGGFGLTTSQTSNVLLTQALASIISQLLLIPRLVNSFGVLPTYRLGLAMCMVIYLLMPFTSSSLLNPTTSSATTSIFPGMLLFLPLLWLHSLASGLYGTSSSIMLTNTAPSPIYLATINGVETSCSCLARTAGPAVVGWLFRVGLERGDVGVAFWCLLGVAGVALGFSWTLRESP